MNQKSLPPIQEDVMIPRTRFNLLIPLVLTAIIVSSCGLLPIQSTPSGNGEWLDWDGKEGWSGSPASGESILGMRSSSDAMEEVPLAAPAEVGGEFSEAESDVRYQNSGLRAGSVDDNTSWDDYLLYRLQFSDWGIEAHDIDVTERHIIRVVNTRGIPILGAEIEILGSNGRRITSMLTHADGTALFFPQVSDSGDGQNYTIVASKEGASEELSLNSDEREHRIVLDARSASDPVRLDVHFLIDATGSMSDEIQQLKDNMISVSERIHTLPSRPDVRFGMTIYRDRGDLFVSRTLDFTPDVEDFIRELDQVVAEGGGDYPESLNEGLHKAIHLPEWRQEETISIIFLIADAPPQLGYPQDYDYAEDALVASERGIKIFPLASSGLDDQGEYIFRQLAQATSGKFLFLTYGAGGAPGDDTTHHVDDYSVLSLDDLVVKVVEEELANLSGLEQ
jgi:hypothetical protein